MTVYGGAPKVRVVVPGSLTGFASDGVGQPVWDNQAAAAQGGVVQGQGFVLPAVGGSVAVDLEAVVNGASTVVAVLTDGKLLEGVVNGSSTVAAALSLGEPLLAVVNGSSTVVASLGLAKLLEAAVAGSSGIAASFSLAKPLVAQVDGLSTVLASLTVNAVADLLEAIVNGSSTVVASLPLSKLLEALVAGDSQVFGDMQVGTPATSTGEKYFPWGAYMFLMKDLQKIDEEEAWPYETQESRQLLTKS
jgi:hypothetical protein